MTDRQCRPVPVQYGRPGPDRSFQRSTATKLSFDDALDAVRTVVTDADLWIIHEIDPQVLLARGGFEIGRARQILFFHPRYMVRLLGADPAALQEAPLKIAVMEDEGSVTARWPAPNLLFDRYGNDQLAALGHEFEPVYASIVSRLTQ